MSQITIRNINPAVEKIIRDEARKQHMSLSDFTNKLILKGLGYDAEKLIKRNLSSFSGRWDNKEADNFDKSQEFFSEIDDEIWS